MVCSISVFAEYFIRQGGPSNPRPHYALSYYSSIKKRGEIPQGSRLASEAAPESTVPRGDCQATAEFSCTSVMRLSPLVSVGLSWSSRFEPQVYLPRHSDLSHTEEI